MASSTAPDSLLQYAPFSSAADPSFWHALAHQKLHEHKLSDDVVRVTGFYTLGSRSDVPPRASVGAESFDKEVMPNATKFLTYGVLFNSNTIDAFRSFDVPTTVDAEAKQIWGDIKSGAALADPSLLARFTLMTFSDLKKYHFYYWFGFPALALEQDNRATKAASLASFLSESESDDLYAQYTAMQSADSMCHAFLVSKGADGAIQTAPLSDWATVATDSSDTFAVAFSDPCALEENPGWPLRNLLVLIAYHFAKNDMVIRIIALRKTADKSITFKVTVPMLSDEVKVADVPPKVIKGLEKDKKQRLRPRVCNLSASMDPLRLATTAVGLNLNLMRWRLMPEIDLPKVAGTKCLLLGAGTLGCNVARLLLGWGVKKITLCDNGTVSYSNPVRQTLFTFEDSAEAKPKAACAAFRLKQIFPGVDAMGLKLSVPMPGHPVSGQSQEEAKVAAAKLEELIEEHDAVFLLMDTRESRWLPTVICAAKDKMCFTAAVGFDSHVSMRHGASIDGGSRNVGCYFCNDVVAPTDSTIDRTLDQQCTVSRPGVSMIVSANVTEMLVALLHHPLGIRAPAQEPTDGTKGSCLGMVPHQVRGFVADFGQMTIGGQAFDKCTACSPTVVDGYKERGFDLVVDAMNTPKFLEDLTGLTEMHKQVNELNDLDFDWSDGDDDDMGGGDAGDSH